MAAPLPTIFSRLALTFVSACLLGLSIRADAQTLTSPTPLAAEAVADFQWFGTLGFPKLRGCYFAHVSLGGAKKYGQQEMQEQFLDGFLLRHEENGQFAILTPELVTFEYTAKPATAETFAVGYEAKSLATEATAYLNKLDQQSDDPAVAMRRNFRQQLTERGQIFVWAWVCWSNGLNELAARLYAKAASVKIYHRDWQEPAVFRERLEQDLGYVMLWRATLDFGKPEIPRTELLRSFERVTHDYSRTEFATRAKETTTLLRQMIAEDIEHAAKKTPPLETLPPEQRVAELIFRLRDQHGEQISQPGSCDIFNTYEHESEKSQDTSAAATLVELGYPAVPALIAALDDRRFSRSVGYWRNFTFSHHVLTVADCAEQILERIAGKRLFVAQTTSSYPSKDGDLAGIKAQAEAWWKTLQTKGEQQTLVDAVSAGDADGVYQSGRLLKRYPAVAPEPMLAGARRAKGWVRGSYIRMIDGLPGDHALEFLREEMRDGPEFNSQVYAAQAVARRGHGDEAVAAMIGAWEKTRDWRKDEEVDASEHWRENPFASLIRFLAGSGRVDAVQALGRDLQARRVNLRMDVVLAFNLDLRKMDMEAGEGGGVKGGGLGKDQPQDVAAAVETLLAAALEDLQIRPGYVDSSLVTNHGDLKVGDAAACVLAVRFPGRYTFDLKAPPKARERQWIGCVNVWRTARGEALMPLPEEPQIKPAEAAVVEPLLKVFTTAQNAKEIYSTEMALTKLGLSALKPLQTFAAALPSDDKAGRTRLSALERTLACTVVKTTLAGVPIADAKASDQVQKWLEAIRGQPVTAELFVNGLAWLGNKVPQELEGYNLRAERDEDLSGVRMTLTVLKSTAGTRDPRYVQERESVSLDGASMCNISGGHVREYAAKTETYQGFAEKAASACRTEAKSPFIMEASMWMGRP